MKITAICEAVVALSSDIRNAYIDFSKMTASVVAVITDVRRDGKRVVGYGFNSNGRYGQGTLMRERFIPRILEAIPRLNEIGVPVMGHLGFRPQSVSVYGGYKVDGKTLDDQERLLALHSAHHER